MKSFKVITVTVENKGLSMSKGLMCDAVFTFESFADELRSCYEDVIVINNLMDMNELEEKIKKLLEKKEFIVEEGDYVSI